MEPYPFQGDAALDCLRAIQDRSRLLIQSPTGTGKTLIGHLTIALLTAAYPERLPRVLMLVPTRALLAQHAYDAGWLRNFGIAINTLSPEMPPYLYDHLLGSYGLLLTTPVTLAHRIETFGGDALGSLDCVIFDEIDTYLTVDELEERKDSGPALQACLERGLPVIGFTGTHLNQAQTDAWKGSGFSQHQVAIPDEWMPLTPVKFVGVDDPEVIAGDAAIRERIKGAYAQLKEELGIPGDLPWSLVRRQARLGNPTARALLRAMTERLQLFESSGSTNAKYEGIANYAKQPGPTLILTRYIETAHALTGIVSEAGVPTIQLDGSLNRLEIERGSAEFRTKGSYDIAALIITRELGGRGLDFPSALRVILVSPRSNYQAVAQEVARIRSRRAAQKEALIYYYTETEEAAKGRRLAESLRSDRYGGRHLFSIEDLPDAFELEGFESRNLHNEEALIPGDSF